MKNENTRITDYYLTCLAEEAGGVTQEARKMIRLGNDCTCPKTKIKIIDSFGHKINDFLAIIELLEENGIILDMIGDKEMIQAKKDKVKKGIPWKNTFIEGTIPRVKQKYRNRYSNEIVEVYAVETSSYMSGKYAPYKTVEYKIVRFNFERGTDLRELSIFNKEFEQFYV